MTVTQLDALDTMTPPTFADFLDGLRRAAGAPTPPVAPSGTVVPSALPAALIAELDAVAETMHRQGTLYPRGLMGSQDTSKGRHRKSPLLPDQLAGVMAMEALITANPDMTTRAAAKQVAATCSHSWSSLETWRGQAVRAGIVAKRPPRYYATPSGGHPWLDGKRTGRPIDPSAQAARIKAVETVEQLVQQGETYRTAYALVGQQHGMAAQTIRKWRHEQRRAVPTP